MAEDTTQVWEAWHIFDKGVVADTPKFRRCGRVVVRAWQLDDLSTRTSTRKRGAGQRYRAKTMGSSHLNVVVMDSIV